MKILMQCVTRRWTKQKVCNLLAVVQGVEEGHLLRSGVIL